jgi:hypothetical protein
LPFDATLLTAKLEALQVDNDRLDNRSAAKRDASKRLSYVPRNAAKQFAATTTNNYDPAPVKEVKRASSTAERRKPSFTADGKPIVNPKQLRAALNIGMTESEATRAIASVPPRRPSAGSDHHHKSKRISQVLVADEAAQLQRSASTRAYRPGDAAKRNAEKKRRSQSLQQQPQQGKLIAIKHGSQTTYERETVPGLRTHHLEHIESALESSDEDQPIGSYRPKLIHYDRPDWSQASQCGEDMHRLLHFGHKEDSRGLPNGQPAPRPKAHRQRSAGTVSETLISDAVSKIKQEEKARRRRSLLGLFKRS